MQILKMIHAERTMPFSTDYPHWDTDYPKTTFKRIPDDLRRRIFHENAAELYGLGTPARV